jgi:hypothetical protein
MRTQCERNANAMQQGLPGGCHYKAAEWLPVLRSTEIAVPSSNAVRTLDLRDLYLLLCTAASRRDAFYGMKMRNPIPWRRLVAMAIDVVRRNPTATHFEWVEAIKDGIIKRGLTYPEELDGIHRAIRAADRVVGRLQREPSRSKPSTPSAPPLSHADAVGALARLGIRVPSMPTPGATATPDQVAAWKQQTRPRYRRTARGWERVDV